MLKAAITAPVNLPTRSSDNKGVHIVVISGGTGGGHKSPADAMVRHLVQKPDVQVTYYRDTVVGPFIDPTRGKEDDMRYKLSNLSMGAAKLANKWRENNTQKPVFSGIEQLLSDPTQFDLVVVNHRVLGDAVAKHLPNTTPMHLETTDHGEMHKGWYPEKRFKHPQSQDRIIVPNEPARAHAAEYLPPGKVAMIPYGVRDAFEVVRSRSREDVRKALNLPMDKQLVVHTCGGGGQASGYSLEVVDALLTDSRAKNLHMVVVTGNNAELAAQLEALKTSLGARGSHLEIRGFCSPIEMAELQYAAGMSEPPSFPEIQAGGGSIGENAAMENVSIIYQKKSGVESANTKYARDAGIVFVALKKSELIETVFTTTPNQIEEKRANVRALGVAGGAEKRAAFHLERAIEARRASQTSTTTTQQQQRVQTSRADAQLAFGTM